MNSFHQQAEDLRQIRSMVEESSRFVSLSGLSGIGAGLVAIAGAIGGTFLFREQWAYQGISSQSVYYPGWNELLTFGAYAAGLLAAAIAVAAVFTVRNTLKKGQKIWTRAGQRLLVNLFFPLAVGGIFCIQLALAGKINLVAGATLIFYGLALLNAGKYTHREVRYLGGVEAGLGLLAGFFPGYGLIFWTIGFGALHILYGTIMYVKYER